MGNKNVQRHFGDLAQRGVWASLYSDSQVRLTAETWSFMVRARYVMELLERHAGTGAVLDVGCGTAPIARAVTAMGRNYVGLDFSAEMVAGARQAHADLGDRFQVAVGDVTSLDLGTRQFGAVVAMGVLEYLTPEQIHQALGEIDRVLRADGCVILTIPKRRSWPRFSYAALSPVRAAVRWRPFRTSIKLEIKESFQRLYLTPAELDGYAGGAGLRRIDGRHYNAQLWARPWTVVAPRLCYLANRPLERVLPAPGLGVLGTGFIGVYRKGAAAAPPAAGRSDPR